jgi:3-phenylpropionate/trans-cinnamate dioxygenase ferredoxin reductase subunit
VGGSYIACEVAASLTSLGKRCTLVMVESAPMCTGFGDDVGRFFHGVLESNGVELVTADPLAGFEGEGRVARVLTESGRALDADMVVMGTGAVPDVMLARASGLELGESGGVACSARLETSAPGIWAAGDACEYHSVLHGRRMRIEHWEVALAQGKAAAAAIAGRPADFAEVPYFWSDLADWCTLEYVGPAASWDDEVVRGSVDDGEFTIFYLDGGRVVAALTVGRSDDLDRARELMISGEAVGADAL